MQAYHTRSSAFLRYYTLILLGVASQAGGILEIINSLYLKNSIFSTYYFFLIFDATIQKDLITNLNYGLQRIIHMRSFISKRKISILTKIELDMLFYVIFTEESIPAISLRLPLRVGSWIAFKVAPQPQNVKYPCSFAS